MRPDNYSLLAATRVPLGSYTGRGDVEKAVDHRSQYELGEYVPGKDGYLELCEKCPFEECVRPEGEFWAYRPAGPGVKQFPGCPVWERGKEEYESRLEILLEM